MNIEALDGLFRQLFAKPAIHKEDEYVILLVSPYLGEEEDLYWSNEMGWVDLASATRFTKEEATSLRKPLEGQWVTQ